MHLMMKKIENMETYQRNRKTITKEKIHWSASLQCNTLGNLNSSVGWTIEGPAPKFNCKSLVTVVGLPKSGKSSFINSIIWNTVQPVLSELNKSELKMIDEQDTTLLEYQLIGPTTFESSIMRKNLRLSPSKSKLKNNYSSSNIHDPSSKAKITDMISDREVHEPNSFDCLRMKDMRAREALVMDFLLKVSDVLVIVIDKYTAIE